MNECVKSLALLGSIALCSASIYAGQDQADPVADLSKQLLKQELIGMGTRYAVQQYPALAPVIKAYDMYQTARNVVQGCYEQQVVPLTPEQEAFARQGSQAAHRNEQPQPVEYVVVRSKKPDGMTRAHNRRAARRGCSSVRTQPQRVYRCVRTPEYINRQREQALLIQQVRAKTQQTLMRKDNEEQSATDTPVEVNDEQVPTTIPSAPAQEESSMHPQALAHEHDQKVAHDTNPHMRDDRPSEVSAQAAPTPSQPPRIPGIPDNAQIVQGPNQRLYAVAPQFNLGAAPRVLANLLVMRKIQNGVASGLSRILPWYLSPVIPFASVAACVAPQVLYSIAAQRPWMQRFNHGLARAEGFVSDGARAAWNWIRGTKPAAQETPLVGPVPRLGAPSVSPAPQPQPRRAATARV